MLECDLVMKGGLTSGTVYPKAIVRLAKDYRFRSIGGTSAGAIAAAAAAAAEYRRQTCSGSMEGFDELAKLPDELGKPGRKKKGATLLELFQPQAPLEALFGMLLSFIGNDRTKTGQAKERGTLAKVASWMLIGRVFANAMLHVPGYALLGAAVALGLAWLLGVSFALSWHLLLLAVFVLGGAAAFALWGLWRAVQKLASNGFGLCRGFEPPPEGMPEDDSHLTPWLHAMIQRTAGLDAHGTPLRFGDLAAYEIDLRAVTSNLCYGHPHTLPFAPGDAWAFFDEREWALLFPKTIIEHLKKHPPSRLTNPRDQGDREYVAAVKRIGEKQGLLPLPEGKDLPVIVAVRLSLSFPLLLSATPIYMLDPRAHASDPAQKCWFSDGGISSNFPLHFFDKLIPGRPTFAINLQEVEKVADNERIDLPKNNHDGLSHTWKAINEDDPTAALAGFLVAIFNLMQNWRDNSLLRLPGYRDRVAAVRLLPHEGGLNLSMPQPLITALAGHGEKAAEQLALHFLPQNAEQCAIDGIHTTWANHRWIRLLSTLAGLEQLIAQLDVWNPPTVGVVASYSDLLDPTKTRPAPSYRDFTDDQRKLALACLVKVRDEIAACRNAIQAAPMTDHTPRPPMHFRLTAES